jgi:hypothetical protein
MLRLRMSPRSARMAARPYRKIETIGAPSVILVPNGGAVESIYALWRINILKSPKIENLKATGEG